MFDKDTKSILILDTQAIRGVLIASSLRRQGYCASMAGPGVWATSDAMMYIVAFDVIGRERLRVLRRRFPFTPIVSYSDYAHDAPDAIQAGADEHQRPDVHDLKLAIERLEPLFAPPSPSFKLVQPPESSSVG